MQNVSGSVNCTGICSLGLCSVRTDVSVTNFSSHDQNFGGFSDFSLAVRWTLYL